jgi:hypothetical protein
LEVQPAHGILEIKWNRSLANAQGASGGELLIRDGDAEKTVTLNRDAVAGGRYSYSPATLSVSFRLTVRNGGGTATESMKVLTDVRPLAVASTERTTIPSEPVVQPATEAPPAVKRVSAVPPRVTASPRAVSEVQPTVPDGIRSRIQRPIVVPVTVEISASGRVVNAVPQGDGDGLYRYLAGRAVSAAKAWRFSPARASNGEAVPTRHTLYFTFRG